MANISQCIFFLYFSLCLCNYFVEFSNKSIYFTSVKQLPLFNPNQLLEQNYETDMIIMKHENNKTATQSNSITLFITNLYYQSIICLDSSNLDTFFPLKNKVLKHISTFHDKNSDSYAEIFKDKYYCLEREEYIDKNINLNEKNNLLDNNFFYNLINGRDLSKSKAPLIEKITNVSFSSLHQSIKEEFSRYFKWNEDCAYELIFYYDYSKELFVLSRLFTYYLPTTPDYSAQFPLLLQSIHNSYQFNQIIINDKTQNKVTRLMKTNETIEEEIITNIIHPTNYLTKIITNKRTSVFHNTMEIKLTKEIVDIQYKKLSIKDKKEKLCYLIHEILTEDTYIEKNEFNNFVNEYLKIPVELHASQFIEQELSSDLSQQAFFSLFFCATESHMESINYIIKFPIHFRYQPSVKTNSILTHQTVVMPAPNVFIYSNTSYETLLFNHILYSANSTVYSSSKAEQLFALEIETKLNVFLSKYYLLLNNYQQLLHQIPAGQMKYFNIIAKITSLSSVIGFSLILYGLFKHIRTNSFQGKSKQD